MCACVIVLCLRARAIGVWRTYDDGDGGGEDEGLVDQHGGLLPQHAQVHVSGGV